MTVRIILIGLCSLFFAESFGQSKKKRKEKDNSSEYVQPTSLDPATYRRAEEAPHNSSRVKLKRGITYDAVERYYERMEMVAKARKKAEKEMMKPQYSDPSYFGHKRPPKKRKPGKMKYCKECGIRH